ncbi:MAG: leucyl/phenylalanyl-tRNA--protein transferase [Verrucomicrobiota bacterium]
MKPLSIKILNDELWFPSPEEARPDGLLAIGGDLSPERLILAYHRGIFPWSVEPISWWSPDPRAVFDMHRFHLSRRVQRVIKQRKFAVTFDQAFEQVIKSCAKPAKGREETWISQEFIAAYSQLHKRGYAHSVECWLNKELVGGVYGVSLGAFFAGESMFYRESNASTVALFHLMERLQKSGYQLFDTQMLTNHTERLGAYHIPRSEYLKRLEIALRTITVF